MKTSIQDLRERRGAKAIEARKILDENTGDKWNAALGDKVDALYAEITDIDTQIARHQKLLDLEAENHAPQIKGPSARNVGGDIDPRSEKALFNKWVRGGDNALTAEDWTHIRNTMSTTTGSEGGYTVQTSVAQVIIDALKAYGGVRRVADVFTTAQGNDLNYPNSDGTSETGELIGQNTTATGADLVLGVSTITPYKFSSKVVAVPIELLQDSQVDMEAFIAKRLRTRLGRVTNTYFTTGTGTSQPKGVVTAATSGKVGTTGQTTSVIYDDIIDLIHSVDPAYRELGNCQFMLNDSSVKVIRKIKDTSGRPIWTPGYESGITKGLPDTLAGYGFVVNQDMATMAANAKSILFGDFSNYKIRDVMDVSLFRFTDSAYTKLGQVGFLAWMRSGGQFVDVGASLKYYQNSAT